MSESKARLRLYVPDDLVAGAAIDLAAGQGHYLRSVMRAQPGEAVALFNGRDGAWLSVVDRLGKAGCRLTVQQQTRAQEPEPDLWLLFAPVKGARVDFMAQKATELGVSRLVPVITERTQVRRINGARLLANAIEAAEQSERLTVPAVAETVRLADVLAAWPDRRRLLVGDETGGGAPLGEALSALAGAAPQPDSWAVLVGPEGGFTLAELDLMGKHPIVTRVGLGPRVLRADTAAIALLAVWQAMCGDWGRPRLLPQ